MKTGFKITKGGLETKKLAVLLAKNVVSTRHSKSAKVLALSGNLGSGKTTFVQGFARGLGIKEVPKSPTFVLVQIFPFATSDVANGKHRMLKSLVHIDAYRLEKPKELLHLGFKEILRDPHNIVVIEWAEKVKNLLPKNTVRIYFKHAGKNKRMIKLVNMINRPL